MSKCPVCGSGNQEDMGFSQVGRSYNRTEGNTTTYGQRYYTIHEHLCLDCGAVYRAMKEPNLKNYLQDKPYFK